MSPDELFKTIKIMKVKKLFVPLILCMAISCTKENPISNKNDYHNNCDVSLDDSKYDEYGGKLLDVLLTTLDDKNFLSFLKNEACNQFDGDYDILIASSLEKPIQSGEETLKSENTTFYNYLSNKRALLKSYSNESILDSIVRYCPLMQISIPELEDGSTENWDVANTDVYIVFLNSEFDESTSSYVQAFDKNGMSHQLSLDTLPTLPVIVISNNERLSVSNLKNYDTNVYYSNEYYTYRFLDCENVELKSYDRDSNTKKDVLYKAKFVSKAAFRQVETWPNGRPEFKVIIAFSEKNGTNVTAGTMEKILSKDGWIKRYVVTVKLLTKTLNIPIFSWDKDIYGLKMKYHWIEQDNGNGTKEINTSLTNKFSDNMTYTTTVKSNVSNTDDDAGEAIVEYMDKTTEDGTWYSTGIVEFCINQPK